MDELVRPGWTLYEYVTWTMVILAVSLQMLNYWLISLKQMKPSYILSIIVGAMFIIIDTTVALHVPEQRGLLFMNILYVWMVAMGIKGLRRK